MAKPQGFGSFFRPSDQLITTFFQKNLKPHVKILPEHRAHMKDDIALCLWRYLGNIGQCGEQQLTLTSENLIEALQECADLPQETLQAVIDEFIQWLHKKCHGQFITSWGEILFSEGNILLKSNQVETQEMDKEQKNVDKLKPEQVFIDLNGSEFSNYDVFLTALTDKFKKYKSLFRFNYSYRELIQWGLANHWIVIHENEKGKKIIIRYTHLSDQNPVEKTNQEEKIIAQENPIPPAMSQNKSDEQLIQEASLEDLERLVKEIPIHNTYNIRDIKLLLLGIVAKLKEIDAEVQEKSSHGHTHPPVARIGSFG